MSDKTSVGDSAAFYRELPRGTGGKPHRAHGSDGKLGLHQPGAADDLGEKEEDLRSISVSFVNTPLSVTTPSCTFPSLPFFTTAASTSKSTVQLSLCAEV